MSNPTQISCCGRWNTDTGMVHWNKIPLQPWIASPSVNLPYTQYPFIRNALIRNDPENSGNFKKPAFKGSNLRNALK